MRTLSAATAVLGLVLLTGPATPAVADDPALPPIPAVPGLPIPSLPTDLLVPQFEGSAATPRPLAAPEVPQHPYLSPNGTSSMHNDAYSTDAYDVSGPLGRRLSVRSRSYGIRECATIAFDSRDRLVGLCGGLEGFTMMVIDPVTLEAVDELLVSGRDLTSGANPLTDICGGTYFFLDPHDHAFATTTDRTIAEIAVSEGGTLTRLRDWPMASYIAEDDCLVATGVDWDGRLWWFSQQGAVGTLDRATGTVRVVRLPAGEGIFNSVSADETGGMYAVTTHAAYRLDADDSGRPRVTWRRAYDRGTTQKPGMLSQGSGTSPTLIGRRWLAIADNAEPRSNVVVYDRRLGVTRRQHCKVPVLASGASTTENSLVAAGSSVIIENNYGYSGVQSTMLGRSTTPGMARVLIGADGCRVAWTNDEVIAPTSVAKASLGNGLVYAYTKPVRDDLVDAWYVSAIDIRTGKVVWSRLTGTGIQWNNHYAAIYLGPDGTLYVATVAGLVRVADG
ncbi:hypothetical protein [Nocardioides antri]|uniref:PQQ-binding-like beta-propeller repeat protein n=1 Tax=Nocardioides antri TaxID=2607659 RepID=A0A5B1M582_9ACTN|nr:hypothetical protein [Nocardioides antri]KAA1427648.1 hypothetical protein F0U47_09395 [Nocardioides antri]